MADIRDVFRDLEPELPELLEPVRLGLAPSMLLLFTADGDPAKLHFVPDPTVKAHVPCPGARCPVCYVGDPPVRVHLLPVVNVRTRAVEVLRVPHRRGPGTLATLLLPHFDDEDLQDKLFVVTRDGARHGVEVQPLGERADRCTAAIEGFRKAREEGLSLLVAFPEYSAAELGEVPEIRRMLDAVGGWDPPENGSGA